MTKAMTRKESCATPATLFSDRLYRVGRSRSIRLSVRTYIFLLLVLHCQGVSTRRLQAPLCPLADTRSLDWRLDGWSPIPIGPHSRHRFKRLKSKNNGTN